MGIIVNTSARIKGMDIEMKSDKTIKMLLLSCDVQALPYSTLLDQAC